MTTGIGFTYIATGEVGEGTPLQSQRCSCGHIRAQHDLPQCLVDNCGAGCDLANISPEEKEQIS